MVTMGGWRTCTARMFVFCFGYVVVPMCALFSLISGLSLCVYSFKIFLFLVKGNFALLSLIPPPTNETTTTTSSDIIIASLLVAPLELAIAAVIMALSGVVYYFYGRFEKARRIEEKDHIRALRADAKERSRQRTHASMSEGGGGVTATEDFNLVLDL
jgi:hypothetical protein